MCASHFSDMITENPLPDSSDPMVLFEWSVRIHNLVNARIGKPIFSTEQAMKRWTSGPSQFDFKFVIIMILLAALVFMATRK